MTCPECKRPTIHRFGGEWCPYCRGFIIEIQAFHVEGGDQRKVRVLQGTSGR